FHLKRRQNVGLPILLRDDLVDRYAQMNVCADGFLRLNATESRRAARMVAAGFTGRRHGRCRIEPANYGDRILPRLQRLQCEWKFGELAGFHCPMRRLPAMWIEDTDKSRDLSGPFSSCRRNQRRKPRFKPR